CLSVLLSPILRRVRSTLFPYTTLFRSGRVQPAEDDGKDEEKRFGSYGDSQNPHPLARDVGCHLLRHQIPSPADNGPIITITRKRSEEHTSELQSLRHLVCRLLLEKKKS